MKKVTSFVWDIETRPAKSLDWISRQTVLARKTGQSHLADPLVVIGIMTLYGRNFKAFNWNERDKFIEFVLKQETKEVELLAHNSKFDTSSILNWLLKLVNFRVYDNESVIPKDYLNKRHAILVWSGGIGNSTLFLVDIKLPDLKKRLIFRDTAPLFAYRSLKELTNSFLTKYNLRKGEIDYTKLTRGNTLAKTFLLNKGLKEYLRNDCLILKLLLLNKELKQVYGHRGAFSLVSTQYKLLLKAMKGKINLNDWDKGSGIDYYELKQSYKGGLTTFNLSLKNHHIPEVYYYDIISAYPNAMSLRIPTLRSKGRCYGVKCYHLLFVSAELKLKDEFKRITGGLHYKTCYPDETIKEDERYHQPYLVSGNIVIWEDEWIVAKQFYDVNNFKLLKQYHFKTEPLLYEYITNLFSKKQQAKLKNLLGKAWVYKIILNSLYGKTGENPLRVSRVLTKDKELKITDKIRSIYSRWYCFQDREIKCDGTERKDIRKDIAVASLICSDVRIRLLKLIVLLKHNFIMCDTDSVISLVKINESKDFKLSKELGDWEVEVRTNFKLLKSKTYCYLNKEATGLAIKAAGYDIPWLERAYKLNNEWNCNDVKCLVNKFNLESIKTKIPNKHTKRNEWGTFFYDRTASANNTKQWTIRLAKCNH